MKASVVDLRYRMHDVLKALERNEDVSVHSHGKLKGVLSAARRRPEKKIREHPFFGMSRSREPVSRQMDVLRGGRHRDL